MALVNRNIIEEALHRVGELLAAEGDTYAIVILGGAALNLLGIVERPTVDVDILAFAESDSEEPPAAESVRPPPEPIPAPLKGAARRVAADLGLAADWLNVGPALQWRSDCPLASQVALSGGASARSGSDWSTGVT